MKLNEIGWKEIKIMNTMVNARKSYAGKMLDDREFFNHLVVRSKLEKNYGELEKKYHNFAALVFGQENREDGTKHDIDRKRKLHLKKKIVEHIYHDKENVVTARLFKSEMELQTYKEKLNEIVAKEDAIKSTRTCGNFCNFM
jgi:hypothetical protein